MRDKLRDEAISYFRYKTKIATLPEFTLSEKKRFFANAQNDKSEGVARNDRMGFLETVHKVMKQALSVFVPS